PAILSRECIRDNRDLLNRADRDRGDRRLASPTFVVVCAVECDCRGAARTGAGDEVDLIDEKIAGSLSLPKRRVEQWKRGCLTTEDRRLIDLLARKRQTDLRIGAHAFGCAKNSYLCVLRSGLEHHLYGSSLA